MKLIKHSKVSSVNTDPMANLSVIGIFEIVEEAVTELMGELKIDGITSKREYNAVWVFAKSRIRLLKSIAWNEEYSVVSFISKVSHAALYVDVEIKNKSDELCVYSRAEVCALDMQTGRLRKVSTVGVDDSIEAEMPITDISFAKYDKTELPEIEQVRVRYTCIDYAGHTNNKEYIRFMLNTYSVQELESRPIREMEVVFLNQSYENDILTVQKKCCEDRDILVLKKDDKSIVKGEVVHGGNMN